MAIVPCLAECAHIKYDCMLQKLPECYISIDKANVVINFPSTCEIVRLYKCQDESTVAQYLHVSTCMT